MLAKVKLVAALSFVLTGSACVLSTYGAPCPCADGYQCCNNLCVSEGSSCESGDGDGDAPPPDENENEHGEMDAGSLPDAAEPVADAGEGDPPLLPLDAELGRLPRHCSADGWCGGRHAIDALFGTSPDDIWAVSSEASPRQTFQHWNGERWELVLNEQLRDQSRVHAIHGADKNVWFAGTNGKRGMVLHFDGTRFHDYYAIDDTTAFRAVWAAGADDVWVAGSPGNLARWNGSSWRRDTSLVADLSGLWGAARDDVWAVGSGGTIAHWDGHAWLRHREAQGLKTDARLWAVWGSSSRDVWVVGSKHTLLHWDGTRWRSVDVAHLVGAEAVLRSVHGRAADDVWVATSEGALLHWDGERWSDAGLRMAAALRQVWHATNGELWATGEQGTAVHWDGESWYGTPQPSTWSKLAVWGSAANDFWVVGEGGHIEHGDGKRWQTVSSPTQSTLRALHGTSKDDVWAVGDEILHWDGSAWTKRHADGGAVQLHSVWAVTPDEAWAVGDDAQAGVILHYLQGAWTLQERVSKRHLRKVWARAANDVWVLDQTEGGLRWDGSTWHELPERIREPDTFTSTVRQILPSNQGETVWLVHKETDNGHEQVVVSDLADAGWQRRGTMAFPQALHDAIMTNDSSMYLVGVGILRSTWGGLEVSAESDGSVLHGVWGAGADVWAVGTQGAVLHREPGQIVLSIAPPTSPCGDVTSVTAHCGQCTTQCLPSSIGVTSCSMGACVDSVVEVAAPVSGPLFGGSGGHEFEHGCAPGEVVTGIAGELGMDSTISVGPRCGRIVLQKGAKGYSLLVRHSRYVMPWAADWLDNEPNNVPPWNRHVYELGCPENAILIGLSGVTHMLKPTDSSPTIGRLGIHCADLSVSGAEPTLTLTPHTAWDELGAINEPLQNFESSCAVGTVITTIGGRRGWFLDAIATDCAGLSVAHTSGVAAASDYGR